MTLHRPSVTTPDVLAPVADPGDYRHHCPTIERLSLNALAPLKPRITAARLIQGVLALVVTAAIFLYFLPRIVDYAEVWAVVRQMTWLEITTLLVLAAWNQVTYWLVEMAGRPGLGYRQALKITHTSTTISNTLPGGAALGAGLQVTMYRSYGFSRADTAISLSATGIWNTFVKLGMPVVALALLVVAGDAGGPFIFASMIGVVTLVTAVVAFAAVLISERSAIRVGNGLGVIAGAIAGLLRRPANADWGEAASDFRRRTIHLIRRRWVPLTAATLVSHLTLFLILLLTLRHVGVAEVEVSWRHVLAAFAFVRLLSAVPITPGGLGVVELGLSATLTAAGGHEASVVAAVLVYRAMTYVLPIPVGAMTYLAWRREMARRRTANATTPDGPIGDEAYRHG